MVGISVIALIAFGVAAFAVGLALGAVLITWRR